MNDVLEEYDGVKIVSRGEGDTPLYTVSVLKLSSDEKKEVGRIVKTLRGEVAEGGIPRDSAEKDDILKAVADGLNDSQFDKESQDRVIMHAFYFITSVGPLQFLLNDDLLEEVMVIGTDSPVYVFHRKFGMCETNLGLDARELRWLVERISVITGSRIDFTTPLLDATLPDGSRVNATIPPTSVDGASVTIRKFRKMPLTVVDLLENRTLSPNLAAFLWMCIEGLDSPPNIVIGGGAGSGKTTLLNVISSYIPGNERIITIEDTLELHLPLPHVVRLLTRPPNMEGKGEITADVLLKNVLRMRPDRVIMGEIRGIEARTLFNAMNTGHKGVTGTIHANSAPEVVSRVVNPPMDVPKNMLTSLDLVVLIEAFHDPGRGVIRRVTDVSEVRFSGSGTIKLNKLYRWDPKEDICKPTGIPGRLEMGLTEALRLRRKEYKDEILRRERLLVWMQDKGIGKMEEVLGVIRDYKTNPDGLMARVDEAQS